MDPTQSATVDPGKRMIIRRLITDPVRSPSKIQRGRTREAIGIPNSLPIVNVPQKAEVKYAPVTAFAKFNSRA